MDLNNILSIRKIIKKTEIDPKGKIAQLLPKIDKEAGGDDDISSYAEVHDYFTLYPKEFEGINADKLASFMDKLNSIAPGKGITEGRQSNAFKNLNVRLDHMEDSIAKFMKFTDIEKPNYVSVAASWLAVTELSTNIHGKVMEFVKSYGKTAGTKVVSRYNSIVEKAKVASVTGWTHYNTGHPPGNPIDFTLPVFRIDIDL